MTITIGIDPHKKSHTASAVTTDESVIATLRVPANRATTTQLVAWAGQWPQRRWAIEGANGLGRLVAQQLVKAGESVVDVPATLAARVRLLDTGHGRKSDPQDARAVATVAIRRADLSSVASEDYTTILRLLADRRDELTQERRRVVNRLHRCLRDLVAGGAPTSLSAEEAAAMLNRFRPKNSVEVERKSVARELVHDVRRLDRALAANRNTALMPSLHRTQRLPRSMGSAMCWLQRSSARSAISDASLQQITSRATQVLHP